MAEYDPSPSRPPPAPQPQNVWADTPNPNSGTTGARARLLESQPISLIPNVTNARLYTMCSRREVPANTPEMKQWDGKLTESPMEAYLKNVRGGLDAVRGDQWGYQVAQQLPDAALNEVGGFLIGKVIGKLADAIGLGRAKSASQVIQTVPVRQMPLMTNNSGVFVLKRKYEAKDFITDHAYKRHGNDPSKISKKNHTRYADNVDPNKIREETLKNPDKIDKLYDSNGNHYATKYSKDMGYNISQSPINSSQSRVFINHTNPLKSSQFPFGK